MAKKSNLNKINTKNINNDNEVLSFIKILITVAIIFCVFYILTVFINKKDDSDNNYSNNNTTKAEIQYDEILIGNIFKQSNESYYVLIENIEDPNVKVYETYLSLYEESENSKRYYTAVLNNIFNIKFLSEKSNLTNDISKFSVSNTTLLEISKGKIKNAYETNDDILSLLKEITKSKEETK